MNSQQQQKRKNDNSNESCMPILKRANTTPTETTTMYTKEEEIQRPSTPPLGMTLSHYDSHTGTYTSSQVNSHHTINSQICTGMTPVYRPPFERWGSCLI